MENRANQNLTLNVLAILTIAGFHLQNLYDYGSTGFRENDRLFQGLVIWQLLTSAMFYYEIRDYIKLHLAWSLLCFGVVLFFVAADYLGYREYELVELVSHVFDRNTVIRQAIYTMAIFEYLIYLGKKSAKIEMENQNLQDPVNENLPLDPIITLALFSIHLHTLYKYGYCGFCCNFRLFQILTIWQLFTSTLFYFQIRDYIKLHLLWNVLYFGFVLFFARARFFGIRRN
ncbi:unnamed protein product [Caenorhabditis angaria]|uniref:Uncharacterized protein n=1 Tax=Caenorhabditis angaria TaxID=860376 RepID=A0A9P1IGE1_9PELO|nr:unnamed protein product [Caenorhabditis angaria]